MASEVMSTPPGSLAVPYGGQVIHLLQDRAIWWPALKTLIVADVHLGKGAAFRHAAIPVPAGASAKDLRRLDALLAATSAARLVVLGDLVHARASHQKALCDAVLQWRSRCAQTEVLLVRGNHDRSAGPVPQSWNISEVEEPFQDGALVYRHAPEPSPLGPVLSGHVHPVVAMRDFDRSVVRVPCFVLQGERCAILPAFGSFTGGHRVSPKNGQRLFMASTAKVVEVPAMG